MEKKTPLQLKAEKDMARIEADVRKRHAKTDEKTRTLEEQIEELRSRPARFAPAKKGAISAKGAKPTRALELKRGKI